MLAAYFERLRGMGCFVAVLLAALVRAHARRRGRLGPLHAEIQPICKSADWRLAGEVFGWEIITRII
jgi:hypothetical protein